MDCFSYPFGRVEDLGEEAVIASYLVHLPGEADVMEKLGAFAVGQSIGTWLKVPGISSRMVECYQGRVVQVQDVSAPGAEERTLLARFAFPAANFGDSLAMMMTALVGNDVSTALEAQLVDLALTGGAAGRFSSPKQGMEQLRAMTGVYGRPLVLNMIKPCAGFTPEEGAALFRQVAMGGVDLIKDDELLGSPDYNDVVQRTALYLKAAEEAAAETGKLVRYVPNISGRPSQMRDRVRRVIDLGAKACLVNFVFTGLDTMQELSEAFGDEIFLLAHYAGVGVMDSRRCGIADPVFLGLLPRLAGAHGVMTMCPNWSDREAVLRFRQTVQAQRLPIPGLAPVVTTVGGGVTPINQALIQQQLGADTIIGIGGAIQGHPMGAAAGAQAAMAAVEATARGISLEEAAESCPPLRRAVELWGR